MTVVVLTLGAIFFGCTVLLIGLWFLRRVISRQWLVRRIANTENKLSNSDTTTLEQLAEILDSIARCLRLGQSLSSAIQEVVNSKEKSIHFLTKLCSSVVNGDAIGDSAKRLITNKTCAEELFVLRTIELASTGGFGGVLALERAAIVLRERATNQHDRKSQAAQASLSTNILSLTPLVVTSWMVMTSSEVRNYLFGTAFGMLCILLGVGLNLIGRKWMEHVITPTAR